MEKNKLLGFCVFISIVLSCFSFAVSAKNYKDMKIEKNRVLTEKANTIPVKTDKKAVKKDVNKKEIRKIRLDR